MKKILFVSSSTVAGDALSGAANSLDCEVVSCAEPEEVIRICAEEEPKLVLVDSFHPETLDGLEMCSRLTADPFQEIVPVLVLVDIHDADSRVAPLRRGAFGCVPYDAGSEELAIHIQAALNFNDRCDDLRGSNTRIAKAMVDMKEAQKKLLEAQSRATLSRLAIAISHEINNPLQTVLGYVELFSDKFEPDTREWRTFNVIKQNILRIRGLVINIQNLREVVHTEYADGQLMVDVEHSKMSDLIED
ncbi:histidine kinase dimerization/phospho-acceptor domain-containing protein [Candidatus Hydrogenedentota bacterium]